MWLFMTVGIITVLGQTALSFADDAAQCVTGYGCEPLWENFARLVVQPSQNVEKYTLALKEGMESGTMDQYYASWLRMNLLINVIMFFVEWYFIYRFSKWMGTTLSGWDKIWAGWTALAIMALLHIGLSLLVFGELSIPFIGFVHLFMNLDVVFGLINFTEVLPLNATIGNASAI